MSLAKNYYQFLVKVRTNKAVEKGVLQRTPCVVCGNEPAEAHHHDYKSPLEVVWLCRQHHAKLHKLLREYQQKCGLTDDEMATIQRADIAIAGSAVAAVLDVFSP